MLGPALARLAHRSDHDPLLLHVIPVGYGAPGPLPKRVVIRRIVAPFTPSHQSRLRDRLQVDTKQSVEEMAGRIHGLEKGKTATRGGLVAQLSGVTSSIEVVLQQALISAMDEVGEPLPQSQDQQSNKHKLRPQQQGHLGTTDKAVFKRLALKKAKITAAVRQLHGTTQERVDVGVRPQAAGVATSFNIGDG